LPDTIDDLQALKRWRPERRLSIDELREMFPDEEACRRFLEKAIWAEGRFCPHCGSLRSSPIRGRTARPGLYQCAESECRRQFTVTTRTPLHATKLPLWKWIQGIYLMLESSKGVSSVVMASWLGIPQKSAWKICHALRLLLSQRHEFGQLLTGTVELDDKFFGGAPRFKKGVKHKRGKGTQKRLIGIAAQRLGPVRAVLLESGSEANLRDFAGRVVSTDARIMSDAAGGYAKIGKDFPDHRVVVHSKKEFARHDDDLDEVVHSNTAEAFASVLERALIGVFHQVGKQHIHRYLDEAVFRWNQRDAVLDGDWEAPRLR